VAALVPRCALLPAPTPRVRAIRPRNVGDGDTVDAETSGRGVVDRRFRMWDVRISSERDRSASGEAPSSGGGGGKECAARHERSNDWPQGGAAPITRTRTARP